MINIKKPLLLYTITSGLGDFIVMGDLIKKIESMQKNAHCFIAHRNNPHVRLWEEDDYRERFFDVYSPSQFLRLIVTLRALRKKGFITFGLQMAPGSVQGFYFHCFLKKMKAIDYIVDFNLINADIITPPKGNYILDMHLNQIKELLQIDFSDTVYQLKLPIKNLKECRDKLNRGFMNIGIHPWSRRGQLSCFVWQDEKWLEVIKSLIKKEKVKIIIFGKDPKYEEFKDYLKRELSNYSFEIDFKPCNSVQELICIVQGLDLLISVNTSVVHIGYALHKKMIILCGPSLDLWIPKGDNIQVISDPEAIFKGSDKYINDERFPSISRIHSGSILDLLK